MGEGHEPNTRGRVRQTMRKIGRSSTERRQRGSQLCEALHAADDTPIVGAIRWDGWYGAGGVVEWTGRNLTNPGAAQSAALRAGERCAVETLTSKVDSFSSSSVQLYHESASQPQAQRR